MSGREENRDSHHHHHSKRLSSRADRDASPKRSRRDGKPVTERTSSKNLNLENYNATSPDHRHRRWFQDPSLLETAVAPDTKTKQDVHIKGSEKKADEPLDSTRRSSNPTEVPRSRSYFQHDERSSAGQGGRNFNRRGTEHGRADPKDRPGEGTREKIVTHDERGDERNSARVDKSVWRHDGFYELESEAPLPKKRPAFREKKIPLEPGNATGAAATESVKPTSFDPPLPDNTRREIKEGYQSRGTDKPQRLHAETEERNTRTADRALHREVHQSQFPSKERFGGSRSFRGRDRLGGRYGERNQHRSSGMHVEKWKHDLFDEANRSPTPKNEEDQIAKVEALLAS